MSLLTTMSYKVAELILHLRELHHEVRGTRHHQFDPHKARRPVAPKDSACYPHYGRLNRNQIVYEEDLGR